MIENWGRLGRAVNSLGPYLNRFLVNAEDAYDELNGALEAAGVRDQVHLWQRAWDVESEMDVVARVAGTGDNWQRFLGCYFGMQYLWLNIRAVEALRAHVVPGRNRDEVYRAFLGSVNGAYRELIRVFLQKAGERLERDYAAGRFALVTTGTLTHQDDIDIGVVADAAAAPSLTAYLNGLNAVATRYAVPLHFYLSEKASPSGLVMTAGDYLRYVNRNPGDFVVISELLNAEILLGDPGLWDELRREVQRRLLSGGEELWREAFLRGVVGEARALREPALGPGRVRPKEEGIRLIDNVVQIDRVLTAEEGEGDDETAGRRERLSRARIFFEVLRYLYRILVVAEEEIPVGSAAEISRLRPVAEAMGYVSRGPTAPEDNLLVHYYDWLDTARREADAWVGAAARRFAAAKTWASLRGGPRPVKVRGLYRLIQSSSRVGYWDDVFEALEADGGAPVRRWGEAFGALPVDRKRVRARQLSEILSRNPEWAMRTAIALGKVRDAVGVSELYEIAKGAVREGLRREGNPTGEAAALFLSRPTLVRDYLFQETYAGVKEFASLISPSGEPRELKEAAASLRALARVRYFGSPYLGGYFLAATDAAPDALLGLNQGGTLGLKSNGLLAQAALVADPRRSRQLLRDYFNVGFCYAALGVLSGEAPEVANAQYVEYADNYIISLFDVCREDFVRIRKRGTVSSDVLGIYSSGGNGRGWGFSEDYDAICVRTGGDSDEVAAGEELITTLVTELRGVGITLHSQLFEQTGRFTASLSELKDFLTSGGRAAFVTKVQLLEARQVVGTAALNNALRTRIIEPYVLGDPELLDGLREEYGARREGAAPAEEGDVKNAPGGLMDVALTLAMVKARYGLWEQSLGEVVAATSRKDPPAGRLLHSVVSSMWYLKRIRDLYRLTVCLSDKIDFDNAGVVAELAGFGSEDDPAAVAALRASVVRTTAKISRETAELVAILAP